MPSTHPAPNPFAAPTADLEGAPARVGDQQLAPRGARLAAAALDNVLLLPAPIAAGIGVAAESNHAGAALVGIGASLLWALLVGTLQIVLLSLRGQTLGKRILKIRIVALNGGPAGFVGAALLRGIVNTIINWVPYLGALYMLVDTLFIFRDDRRCVHDLIASTIVVQADAPPPRG